MQWPRSLFLQQLPLEEGKTLSNKCTSWLQGGGLETQIQMFWSRNLLINMSGGLKDAYRVRHTVSEEQTIGVQVESSRSISREDAGAPVCCCGPSLTAIRLLPSETVEAIANLSFSIAINYNYYHLFVVCYPQTVGCFFSIH